jgi:hypothetical protein
LKHRRLWPSGIFCELHLNSVFDAQVMHDVNAVISELLESGQFVEHVNQLLASCPTEVLALVKHSILQAVEPLKELLPAIMNVMIMVIVKRSNEDLKHLKGITATYRMTNKLPVRHSPYVSGILHPLKVNGHPVLLLCFMIYVSQK